MQRFWYAKFLTFFFFCKKIEISTSIVIFVFIAWYLSFSSHTYAERAQVNVYLPFFSTKGFRADLDIGSIIKLFSITLSVIRIFIVDIFSFFFVRLLLLLFTLKHRFSPFPSFWVNWDWSQSDPSWNFAKKILYIAFYTPANYIALYIIHIYQPYLNWLLS